MVSLMHQSTLKNASTESHHRPSLENGLKIGDGGFETERVELREASDSFGRLGIEDEQPNYVGASHWAAILDSVRI